MTETTHEDQQSSPHLPIKNNLKIALFHLGSGMADVITAGVWNRIMITDLGFAATPISLLVGLRYFLAPLGVWAGRISDERAVGGYRRLFWIWLGRPSAGEASTVIVKLPSAAMSMSRLSSNASVTGAAVSSAISE